MARTHAAVAALLLAASCAKKEPPPPPPAPPAPMSVVPVEQKAADKAADKPKADTSPWDSVAELEAKCTFTEKEAARLRQLITSSAAAAKQDTVLAHYNELGAALDQGLGLIGLMAQVHPDKAARDAAEACETKLQRLVNDINLDRGLFDALQAVPPDGLDPQAKRFVEKVKRDFRRAGVDKDEATRTRLRELHEEMVKTGQAFSRNIREDVRTLELDPADLEGLPEDFLRGHKPGENGKAKVTTDYPDYFPVQTYAKKEETRKQLAIAFLNRGYPSNEPLLKKLLELRFEYAKALGYPTWAAYQAEDKMVKSAKAIEKFIADVAAIARPRMKKDLADLLARKKKDDPKATAIAVWDRFYYVDKVRSERFGVEAQAIRQYFDYPKVEAGILELYGELFGLRFARAPDASVWHPAVKAYDMFSGEERIGRFYLDMHPRDGKYKHAAMFNISTGLAGGRFPEAALVCNFADPSKSEGPALMEHGDVITFFHEFGHLIHQLLARDSKWINQSGINVEWDFVEAPSQLLEEWAWDPAVLARFAKKPDSGEPIPAELVKKMKKASEFGKGIHVMRQVAYTALSYELHSKDPAKIDLLAFQKDVQKRYSPYPFVEETHEYAGFGHLEGYSSMYYTYQWSLVLAKDIFTRFEKAGLMDRATFAEYRSKILAPGGMKDANDLVTGFLGRPWNLKAYKTWLEKD